MYMSLQRLEREEMQSGPIYTRAQKNESRLRLRERLGGQEAGASLSFNPNYQAVRICN